MTARRPVVLGVDGGNTKTVARIADGDGRTLGEARGGATDIHSGSPEQALAEIARVAGDALTLAGLPAGRIDSAAFSLAGADWPEDFALLEAELPRRIGLAAAPLVVNDALGALRSGSPAWTGVAVACGTYNAIGARNSLGDVFHFGFWPDQAGGADLGRSALKAVYREGLGLGPATSLTGRALAAFGAADWQELAHGFTRLHHPIDPGRARELAFGVLDAASEGDAVACSIVKRSASVLAGQARIAAARLAMPLEGLTLVLTGSVLQHGCALLRTTLLAALPGAIPILATAPPVAGAVALALDRARAG